jgi:sugar phosphate isomerase/epimerase
MLGASVLTAGTLIAGRPRAVQADAETEPAAKPPAPRRMKLGLVTYNLARDWDLEAIIKNCRDVGIRAVEFRSTHKHGVEPTLSKSQREDVRKRCADGGLVIWGVGSACEYHSPDPATVRKNIEETKEFIELARDIGAKGVKVRPNGLPREVPEEKTLEQIGHALREVGETASSAGVEIWCEMHGSGTAHPPRMKRIMDIAGHPSVGVTWNSNHGIDEIDGSIRTHFEMMRPKIYSVHINELVNGYPYRELFQLLNQTGYDRYTMIEAQALKSEHVEDTIRFMRFYKGLWEELSRPSRSAIRS